MKLTLQEIVDKLRNIHDSCTNAYNTTPEYQANSDGLYYMDEAQNLVQDLIHEIKKINNQGYTIS
jgi:hypothetical protein